MAEQQPITHDAWWAEAVRRFGDDLMRWRFVCPSCGHVASVADWKAAGASAGEIAFSCVGRRTGAGDSNTFKRAGGPCNYAGGGLFELNPARVIYKDGHERRVFAFAEPSERATNG